MHSRADEELLARFEEEDAERDRKIAELEEKLREKAELDACAVGAHADLSPTPAVPATDRPFLSNLALKLGLDADAEADAVEAKVKDLVAFHDAISTDADPNDELDDPEILDIAEKAFAFRGILSTVYGDDEINDDEFDPESFLRKRQEVFEKVIEELSIDSSEDVPIADLEEKIEELAAIKASIIETFKCKPEDARDEVENLTMKHESLTLFIPAVNDLLDHIDKFYPPRYVPSIKDDDAALQDLFEDFFNAARNASAEW